MQTLFIVLFVISVIGIARILERKWPIAATPVAEVIEDCKLVSINLTLVTLLVPLTTRIQWSYLEHPGARLDTFTHSWLLVLRVPRHPGNDF